MIFTRRAFLQVAAVGIFTFGCASRGTSDFMKAINSIRPGTSASAVREHLGRPDETRDGVVELNPAPGPAERLIHHLPAGTRYRDWIYKRNDSHYHVFLAPRVRGTNAWEVILVRSVPADTVY